jgi:hypothetical protein
LSGSELSGSELSERGQNSAKVPVAELSGSKLSESGQNGAKVPGAELPGAELSGAGEIQLSFEAATKATTASTLDSLAFKSSTLPSSSVSAALRRLVFRRDQRCQWLDPVTGRKCGSRHLLELDHIQSRWAGGLDEPSNLRLLCRSHNGLKYRLEARIRACSARAESL